MKKIKSILLLAFALLAQSNLFSQPGGPPGGGPGTGGGNPACWPPPCVPVDNGIIALIAAGTLLAAKTLYDFRKKSKTVS